MKSLFFPSIGINVTKMIILTCYCRSIMRCAPEESRGIMTTKVMNAYTIDLANTHLTIIFSGKI